MAYTRPNAETQAEAGAVASLVQTLRDMGIDSPEILDASIDSETNFREVVEARLKAVGEVEAMIAGLKEYIDTLDQRKKRLEQTRERIRAEIGEALELSGQDRFVTAYGTLSPRRGPPKLNITQESQIPDTFYEMRVNTAELKAALVAWKRGLEEQTAIPDGADREAAILRYYRENPPITGAELIEGAASIAIKRK